MTIQTERAIKWLSVSKIGVFMRCGQQAYHRYVEKVPEPSSGVMLSGRVVHAVLEKALRKVMGGDKLPTASEMDDFYDPIWQESVQEEEEKENFLGWKWDDGDPEADVKESCRGLVRIAREEVLPKLKPTMVEHNFHMTFDHEMLGESYRIYGVIDLVEEGGLVSDWKTAKAVTAGSRKLDVQMSGYSWWAQNQFQKDVTKSRKIFLVRGKKRRPPKVEIVNYEVTQHHRDWFKYIADRIWSLIQAEAFVPNPSSWACSEKFCSFWNLCPEGDPL